MQQNFLQIWCAFKRNSKLICALVLQYTTRTENIRVWFTSMKKDIAIILDYEGDVLNIWHNLKLNQYVANDDCKKNQTHSKNCTKIWKIGIKTK